MENSISSSLVIPHTALPPADRRARLVAGALTALIYLGFASLLWQRAFWTGQDKPQTTESFVILQAHPLERMLPRIPPPFLVRLIRPHAQSAAPPTFTIASSEPIPDARLPVTAANELPLAGGPQLDGAESGANVSGVGTNGDAASSSACLDPEWLSRLHEHIRHYFYTPRFIHDLAGIGPVFLRYTVNKQGQILKLDLARSSGSEMLDDFALDRMRDANPLPAIPDRMHTNQLRGLVILEFGPLIPGSTIGNC